MGGKFSYSISSMKIATLIAIYALLFYMFRVQYRYDTPKTLLSRIAISDTHLCMSITIGSAYQKFIFGL